MTELTDKEKALLILEKASEEFTKCTTEIRKLQESLYALNCAFENAGRMLNRCLNEEANGGNIHKECEYYNSEKDYCSNYMMGKYTGLAFEVSRHDKCIKDLVEK